MAHYEIVQGKPEPLWTNIKKKIDVNQLNTKRISITFGNKIYIEHPIDKEILEHELIHVYQQTVEGNADEWWALWLASPQFRYEQELEGYRKQIEVFNKSNKDRNKRHMYKTQVALVLCGPAYGMLKSFNEVFKDLT